MNIPAQLGYIAPDIWPASSQMSASRVHYTSAKLKIYAEVLKPGACIPVHMFPYSDQLYFVIRGKLTILNSHHQKVLCPGDAIIIHGRDGHALICEEDEVRYLRVVAGKGAQHHKTQMTDKQCKTLASIHNKAHELDRIANQKSPPSKSYESLEQ